MLQKNVCVKIQEMMREMSKKFQCLCCENISSRYDGATCVYMVNSMLYNR